MKTDLMFSSKKPNWETPKEFFLWVSHVVNGFTIDVAASKDNHIVPYYIDEEEDSIKHRWNEGSPSLAWCNPPHGRGIMKWIHKAIDERSLGNASVLLVPARTDTKWFQLGVKAAENAFFLKGRLKFTINGKEQDAAPFPSCLLFFGYALSKRQKQELETRGFVL